MQHRVRLAATYAGGLRAVRRGHGDDISQDQNSGVFGMHRTYNYKDITILRIDEAREPRPDGIDIVLRGDWGSGAERAVPSNKINLPLQNPSGC
jgi:hypothetical protein